MEVQIVSAPLLNLTPQNFLKCSDVSSILIHFFKNVFEVDDKLQNWYRGLAPRRDFDTYLWDIDINRLTWATICRTSYKCDVFEAFNSFIKKFFVGGYNMKLLVCDLDDFNKPSVLCDNKGSQTAKPPYTTIVTSILPD